jgi:Tol biopolymer transport system component
MSLRNPQSGFSIRIESPNAESRSDIPHPGFRIFPMLPAAIVILSAFGTPSVDVTVHEGTSMSVAASPDGRSLAIDLQGSIWTLSASGGTAKRITDVYNDSRQPSWSPDGRWIAFQGYRDGIYHIWAVAPDGSSQHALTWGPFDDREPAWSHDGTRVAFSSDRSGNYDVWVLDTRSGSLTQVTTDPADDFMPAWAPNDSAIAFISTRGGGTSVWVIPLGGGTVGGGGGAVGGERRITSAVRADAPSWGPAGALLYHATEAASSRYEMDGRTLTGGENVFAFRAAWLSPREFVYVSDGKIRARSLDGAESRTIEFSATLTVTPASYTRRKRDFDSRAPRRVLGVVRPVISPDGRQVAFSALGDIYLMPVGGEPENLTNSRFLDTEPAWSPDGTELAYASDKGGGLLDIWVRDLKTGRERRLTKLQTSATGPAWSPDGKRIAFLDNDGIWRRANVSVVDVATGQVTRIHEPLFGPGMPTWSPDGKRVAVAAVKAYSARFREGTNQILTMSSVADGGGAESWFAPVAHLSIDSRVGAGPAWSPDGTKMAVIYEGMLAIVPVTAAGEPIGPPRRITSEMAHAPSWTGDSKHILYQSMDKLRMVDLESGAVRDVPLDLRYTLDVPAGRLLVHAGRLVDGRSERARAEVDIIIEGNRIKSVEPHRADRHAGIRVVDASNLTVMPGLIEFHSHLQPDYGESHFRAWLAYGITTLRSPGGTPYEAAADRETSDAGVRPGPRVFSTGYLLEWNRAYYKMSVAISTPAHLELELQRAKILQHDLIKSYVRMPDLQQRRIVEFAHGIGVPSSSHEVYPAALSGIDGTEHTTGTSRRGYSPKLATLQRSYDDVTQILGKAGMTLTPTLALGGVTMRNMIASDSGLRSDPRLGLYPSWLRAMVVGGGTGFGPLTAAATGPTGRAVAGSEMVMSVMKAGGHITAGTDTPSAAYLHAELMAYVAAGMTPFEALQTATVNSAAALGLDAGSIEVGKLADLVIVDGNPLENIAAARRVKRVIANGRVYDLDALVKGTLPERMPTAPPR